MLDQTEKSNEAWTKKLTAALGKPVKVELAGSVSESHTSVIAVTSSRLGLDPKVHRMACRFLSRSMYDCRQRGGSVLVAEGSAIDEWASRASELFGVPLIRLFVNDEPVASRHHEAEVRLVVRAADGTKLSRDTVAILIADRVDAVHIRQGGTIFQSIMKRLESRDDATTRVAVSSDNNDAAISLIDAGAIGWYFGSNSINNSAEMPSRDTRVCFDESLDWTCTEGQWLIHCTRGQSGPWPGETERQYRDAMLIGDTTASNREPIDTLTRIIRSRRLVGSCIASDHRFPVVCFSAASLRERMRARSYRPHLNRWDCEPFGIAIRVDAASKLGAVPVIYGQPKDRERINSADQFRFQSCGTTYDWTAEKEWRVLGDVDLTACHRNDIRVFVPSPRDAANISSNCPWNASCVAPLLRHDAII